MVLLTEAERKEYNALPAYHKKIAMVCSVVLVADRAMEWVENLIAEKENDLDNQEGEEGEDDDDGIEAIEEQKGALEAYHDSFQVLYEQFEEIEDTIKQRKLDAFVGALEEYGMPEIEPLDDGVF